MFWKVIQFPLLDPSLPMHNKSSHLTHCGRFVAPNEEQTCNHTHGSRDPASSLPLVMSRVRRDHRIPCASLRLIYRCSEHACDNPLVEGYLLTVQPTSHFRKYSYLYQFLKAFAMQQPAPVCSRTVVFLLKRFQMPFSPQINLHVGSWHRDIHLSRAL